MYLRSCNLKPQLRITLETAEVFGSLAAKLKKAGLDPNVRINDLWLAAQAIQRDFTLLTSNPKDFKDIQGLKVVALPSHWRRLDRAAKVAGKRQKLVFTSCRTAHAGPLSQRKSLTAPWSRDAAGAVNGGRPGRAPAGITVAEPHACAMQPVSPIPHLGPSATIRPRRQAKEEAHSFRANLAQMLNRISAPSLHAEQSTRRAGAAPASWAGRRPAASLVRFERPRVYRYVRDPGRASGVVTDSADSTRKARSAGAPQRDDAIQVEESTKAALVRRIHTFARRLGVDPALSEAIARAESGLDQTARSPDGQTKGAFQMKGMTAAAMHERLQNDPAGLPLSDEVTLGIGYLRYLDGLFATRSVLDRAAHTTTPIGDDDERRRFAIAAYNAGEGRVAAAQRKALSAGGDPRQFDDVRPFLPAVTRRYVNRVLTLAASSSRGPETPVADAVH